MNGIGFQMPESIEVDQSTYGINYGKFVIQPLEQGYATTIGNAMRRVLLSSLPGTAITSIRIDGVSHEFSTLKGVKEGITELIIALKGVRVKLLEPHTEKVHLNLKGPMVLTAGDLAKDTTDFEILNPDHVIANLNSDAELRGEILIQQGRGYVSADENRDEDAPLGTIPIDAIYTPVHKVNFSIENTRVGQRTDFEKLIVEVWTDGSITPDDALTHAGKIIRDHIQLFINFEMMPGEDEEEIETDEEILRIRRLLRKPVDELELTVRAANCLKEARIRTIADLVSYDEPEMLKFKNFGRKSLNELNEILVTHNLYFGLNINKYIGVDSTLAR
jgi:DNA-directed RNA polymerase subunit alpha